MGGVFPQPRGVTPSPWTSSVFTRGRLLQRPGRAARSPQHPLVWSLEHPSVGYRQGMRLLRWSSVNARRTPPPPPPPAVRHNNNNNIIITSGARRERRAPPNERCESADDLDPAYVEPPRMRCSRVDGTYSSRIPRAHEGDNDSNRFVLRGRRQTREGTIGGTGGVRSCVSNVRSRGRTHARASCEARGGAGAFLLRWLRVLFSREFHLDDAMLLWDAIIAENKQPQNEGGQPREEEEEEVGVRTRRWR